MIALIEQVKNVLCSSCFASGLGFGRSFYQKRLAMHSHLSILYVLDALFIMADID